MPEKYCAVFEHSRQGIPERKKIMIKPDHYFAIASDAIGLSFKQLNSLMKQLSNTLEKEYDNQYKTLYISLFSTFLSTLLVVEMFILQLAE